MARVVDDDLAEIYPVVAGKDYTVHIDIASDIVTRYLVTKGGLDETDDAYSLKEVERWLAAHFAAINDKDASNEKAGPVAASYFGKVGMHLEGTRYGQQAIAIDPTGQLAAWQAALSKGARKIQVQSLGSTKDDPWVS